ncbi:MAG: hypothetical protein PCFJNLEI_02050 [Verrucomicrobiae bacterium]|nr:hypothetical protein [Verrucomicrobiae bacterium]
MKAFSYVLAIDPGGTKCAALLVKPNGTIVARHQLRDWKLGGRHPKIMQRAMREVLRGHTPAPLLIVAIGGKKWNLYLPAAWRRLAQNLPSSESAAALATIGKTTGVVVIAGTGARITWRTATGTEFSLDALGPLLGDDGSGYYIGRATLRALARGMQLRHPVTRLRRRVLRACRCRDMGDLVRFSLQPRDRSLIASLTKIVNDEAEAGDPLARALLRTGATAMAATVHDLVRHWRLAGKKVVFVGAGSVATQSDLYWRELRRQVRRIAPRFQPRRVPLPPVAGLAAIGLANPPAIAKLFATFQKGHHL